MHAPSTSAATTTTTPPPSIVLPRPERHALIRRPSWALLGSTLAWLVPTIAMFVIGWWGLHRPVLGWDEMATWNAAQRPPDRIYAMIQTFDGVLSPYYFFMHWWMGIFGTSHTALRMPSLLAMTLAAGLVARLGTRLITPFGGLVAGLLFAVVPSISRYAQEARPYGFAVLFAVLATLLLVRAIDQPGWWRWAAYAGSVFLLGLANILAFLLLLGHVVAIGWRFVETKDRRLLRWLPATALGVLPCAPLITFAMHQHTAMLAWLHVYDWKVAAAAPVDIFGTLTAGTGLAGLIVLGLALAGRPTPRWVQAGTLAMAVLPTAVLLLVSIFTHVWVPRYVLFTVALWAVLAAFALYRTPVQAVLVILLVAGVSAPAQFEMRGLRAAGNDTHTGPDNRLYADLLREHARPGDAIIYSIDDMWSTRNGIEYYLGADAPRDVLLHRSRVDNNSLLDTECPDAAACIGDTQRLWVYRCMDSKKGLTGIGSAEQFIRQRTKVVEKYAISGCYLNLYAVT